jgi:hypothetical protein
MQDSQQMAQTQHLRENAGISRRFSTKKRQIKFEGQKYSQKAGKWFGINPKNKLIFFLFRLMRICKKLWSKHLLISELEKRLEPKLAIYLL